MNREGNVWAAITSVFLGLSLVDWTVIGLGIVTFIITAIVNRTAYKKHQAEAEAAKAQKQYYDSQNNKLKDELKKNRQ